MESIRYRSRVLIIGSGLAGCTAALVLANQGHEVSLLTPADELDGGNSTMAQGGIVFVKDKEEARALESDMYVAGHRYNFGKAVRFLATQGGEAVQRILVEQLRVPFNHRSADSSDWDLTLEGGHSAPRILHCADYTGRAIMEALHAAIAANPRVRVLNHRSAVDLITTEHHAVAPAYRYQLRNQCVGAYVFNDLTSQVEPHLADYTVLATGGVGQVYLPSYGLVSRRSTALADHRGHARGGRATDQRSGRSLYEALRRPGRSGAA